jgi:hypothetical protein
MVTTHSCGTLKREKETLLSFEQLLNISFGMTPMCKAKTVYRKFSEFENEN